MTSMSPQLPRLRSEGPRSQRPQPQPRPSRRGRIWWLLVPVVLVAAGALFSTSAETAHGTDLRSGQQSQLSDLIHKRDRAVAGREATAKALRASNDRVTRARNRGNGADASAQAKADALTGPAGLGAVRGPGLRVTLNDAPRRSDGKLPTGATPDDVVVHQQDVQSVANALWAGGAEAMTLMGQRVIATAAVRCVGNVLLLYGQTYSPPFSIVVIGPSAKMREALRSSPGVRAFAQASKQFGLGYQVSSAPRVRLPGYGGQLALPYTTGGT